MIKLKMFFDILKKSLPIGTKKGNPDNKKLKIIDKYLKSVVGPASKLHITILVIEGEPSNVNLTGGFEYSRRNISTAAFVRHNHVGWESSIKLLVSAEKKWPVLTLYLEQLGSLSNLSLYSI